MTTASQRETTPASASMATAKEICKPRDDIPSRASSLVLYAASDVKRTRRTPFRLAEPDGVRLDLAFRAIAPLKLRTRIEDILYGIHEINREEARYWHAMARRNNGPPTRTNCGYSGCCSPGTHDDRQANARGVPN